MIKGIINGQSLKISAPLIASDTVRYVSAEFVFLSEDWEGLEIWAHFSQRVSYDGNELSKSYDIKLVDGKIDKNEMLNLSAGIWEVYLHGVSYDSREVTKRVTTEVATFAVVKSGVKNGDPLPISQNSVAEYILALIGDISKLETSAKTDIVTALNTVIHPVRGVDYWTNEDKEEIVEDVLSSIEVWEGGSY